MRQTLEVPRFPSDWPAEGPIDLARHDLPHASSTTEGWRFSAHLVAPGWRALSLFAAFRRALVKVHPDGRAEYGHALAWGLCDLDRGTRWARSYVDASAPRLGLERLRARRGAEDEWLGRALAEVLAGGQAPLPDRVFPWPVRANPQALDLDFGPCRLEKLADGRYVLSIEDESPRGPLEATLTFTPSKPAVRHGDSGVVPGPHGVDVFHYFIPRCRVAGVVSLPEGRRPLAGSGWYERELGRPPPGLELDHLRREEAPVAWTWLGAQLDDGTDVCVYEPVRPDTKASAGRFAVVVDAAGRRRAFREFTLVPAGGWLSARTLERHPTRFALQVPAAELSLDLRAAFPDQETATLLSKAARWEGRCHAEGTLRGRLVRGPAHLRRGGSCSTETLHHFLERVGEVVHASVRRVMPVELDHAHALGLVAGPGREHYLEGVDLPQLSGALVAPVRAVADRGGEAWRAWAAPACCQVVGGDPGALLEWLAVSELVHAGSLVLRDAEGRHTARRGGPAAHVLFGDGVAVNAGAAASLLGGRLATHLALSDADKLRIHGLYFEALRAGHAGQALDLDGLARWVPAALQRGEHEGLELRVLAVHRLKGAAPAAAFARMGAVAGGGTAEQVDALGGYFEALGLASAIVEEVLELQGAEGGAGRGAYAPPGKVTLPVAKALRRLDARAGRELWGAIASRPQDPAAVAEAIARIEACGALDACRAQAASVVEAAWTRLAPLVEASRAKLMLRAFGWYVLERRDRAPVEPPGRGTRPGAPRAARSEAAVHASETALRESRAAV